MAKINNADNLNQGLPENTGLDEGTRASLQRQLDKADGGTGIAVNSFADLQRGTVGNPIDGPFNENQPTEGLVTVPEIAANEADAQAPGRDSKSSDSKKSKK